MSCSRACRTVTLRSTKPSARSTKMPTSLACRRPTGRRRPAAASPASTTTSSALTPEPSSWRLQRMQGPAFGMPCRSVRGGLGGGAVSEPAADDGDEVGVVGAVHLVVVAERARVAAVCLDRVLRAGGVVRRLLRGSAARGRGPASPRRGRCCPTRSPPPGSRGRSSFGTAPC